MGIASSRTWYGQSHTSHGTEEVAEGSENDSSEWKLVRNWKEDDAETPAQFSGTHGEITYVGE